MLLLLQRRSNPFDIQGGICGRCVSATSAEKNGFTTDTGREEVAAGIRQGQIDFAVVYRAPALARAEDPKWSSRVDPYSSSTYNGGFLPRVRAVHAASSLLKCRRRLIKALNNRDET